jgi:Mg/Co/Ni transporter MgtE
LHLFSASPELLEFGSRAYQRRSENTSALLGQVFERLQREDWAMSYTMKDFQRQYAKEHFRQLTPEERREALQSLPSEERRQVLQWLPPEELREVLQSLPVEEQEKVFQSLPLEKRLAGLSAEQIRQYLDRLTAERPMGARRPPRRKK